MYVFAADHLSSNAQYYPCFISLFLKNLKAGEIEGSDIDGQDEMDTIVTEGIEMESEQRVDNEKRGDEMKTTETEEKDDGIDVENRVDGVGFVETKTIEMEKDGGIDAEKREDEMGFVENETIEMEKDGVIDIEKRIDEMAGIEVADVESGDQSNEGKNL